MIKLMNFEKKLKLVDIVSIFMYFEKMCVGLFEIFDIFVYFLILFNLFYKY